MAASTRYYAVQRVTEPSTASVPHARKIRAPEGRLTSSSTNCSPGAERPAPAEGGGAAAVVAELAADAAASPVRAHAGKCACAAARAPNI